MQSTSPSSTATQFSSFVVGKLKSNLKVVNAQSNASSLSSIPRAAVRTAAPLHHSDPLPFLLLANLRDCSHTWPPMSYNTENILHIPLNNVETCEAVERAARRSVRWLPRLPALRF